PVDDLRAAEEPFVLRENDDVIQMIARSVADAEEGVSRLPRNQIPAIESVRRNRADHDRGQVAVRSRGRPHQTEGDQHCGHDQHHRQDAHFFTFPVSLYNLTMDIASLCIDAYLKRTSRFSPQGHILRHRWTKTVPRLVLLDANALLMPFQFQVHLDAELRRVVGDVEVAVPTPVLAELDLLADHDRNARAAARLAKNYRTIEGHGPADDALPDPPAEQPAALVTK